LKILVLGAAGQVGGALVDTLAALGEVIGLTRQEIDLSDIASIGPLIGRARPDLIVNAAAYTAVDQAEIQPELAETINGAACRAIARAALECQSLLVHYSTDYVFDGTKSSPYVETDPTHPVNAYGASKLHGEEAIAEVACDAIILRTTWVFAPTGKNFVRTILRLASEREQLKVIDDQIGAPTSALHLASATTDLARIALKKRAEGTFSSGLYHLCASGSTSWYGFAEEIVHQWRRRHGHESLRVASIEPIPTIQYPTPAARPKNSRLSNAKIEADYRIQMPPWQDGLNQCLALI